MAVQNVMRFAASLLSLLLPSLAQQLLSSSSVSTIVNDMLWKDTNSDYIKAGYGGHITLIDGVYYWVGNDPDQAKNGADIHIYSSRTLGSSDWSHVVKAVDTPAGTTQAGNNCNLLRSPTTGKYVLVSKNGFMFYESSDVAGPYSLVRTLSKSEIGPNRGNWKVGGMSTFQEGSAAYVITSRRDLKSSDTPPPRHVGIYKLTPDFLNVESEVLWFPIVQREAMWLFKKGTTYYMTASHTSGWSPSQCYYRTAESLSGPWSEEHEIGMDPEPVKKSERSHGSQCRWIKMVGEDQWMFAGDRYPYQPNVNTSEYDLAKGHYIFLPVSFDSNNHPTVTWQSSWEVTTVSLVHV